MTFSLFIYDRLRDHPLLDGCMAVADASVGGILYDLGDCAVLLLYGSTPVRGQVVRCPAALLQRLDTELAVGEGRFRRVGVEAETAGQDLLPCWVYTAGPALSRRLLPDRRVAAG
ncbi:MAG: gamma-glutamylcyclotransferase [Gemmatimonadota bacterium]